MSKLYSAIVLLLSISLVQSKPLVDNDAIVFRDSDEDVSNNSSLLYGDHFQGDIILNSEQEDIFLNKSGKLAMGDRTGLIHEAWRWPKVADGNVNVPIEISSSFDFHKHTCIRFVWKNSNHADYIYIKDGDGCSSSLGMVDGKQYLTLQKNGCLSKATIQHEFIHALGYTHMHNHVDRDKFVTIEWDNIETKHKHNFKKVQAWQYGNFGTPYDYYSVMHYDSNGFSVNGEDTIMPTNPSVKNIIGHVKGMSPGDIQRINKMYDCPASQPIKHTHRHHHHGHHHHH